MLDKLQTVKIIVNSNLTQTLHPYCTSNCANVFSFSFLSTHLSIIQLSNVFSLQTSNTKGNLLKPPLSIQLIISSLSLVFNTLWHDWHGQKKKFQTVKHFSLLFDSFAFELWFSTPFSTNCQIPHISLCRYPAVRDRFDAIVPTWDASIEKFWTALLFVVCLFSQSNKKHVYRHRKCVLNTQNFDCWTSAQRPHPVGNYIADWQ